MRITFLIGNGFDIGLGLRTQYSQFYETLKKETNNIIEANIYEKIHSEDANKKLFWKDYELALGELLTEIQTNDEKDKFNNDKFDMDERIASYIAAEQNKYPSELVKKYAMFFYNNLINFHSGLIKREKDFIDEKLTAANSVEFDFITFNYTNILDNFITEINELTEKDEKYIFNNPLHIHGDLTNGIITGVDNDSQIKNKIWANNFYFKSTIIKRSLNEYHGEGRTDAATSLINSSDIVCIFGMSLGETDFMWWKIINSWLQTTNKTLIIYDYRDDANYLSLGKQTNYVISVRQQFLKASKCTNENIATSIFGKIFVIRNSKIFEFKISEDENNG